MNGNKWTSHELNILRDTYESHGATACTDLLPGRSKQAIYIKARDLGLKIKRDHMTQAAHYPAHYADCDVAYLLSLNATIRALRIRAGLSVQALARLAGYSDATIYRIEAGSNCSFFAIRDIFSTLCIEVRKCIR